MQSTRSSAIWSECIQEWHMTIAFNDFINKRTTRLVSLPDKPLATDRGLQLDLSLSASQSYIIYSPTYYRKTSHKFRCENTLRFIPNLSLQSIHLHSTLSPTDKVIKPLINELKICNTEHLFLPRSLSLPLTEIAYNHWT